MPKKSTTEEFIKKAKKVHGDRYSYELSKYVNSRTDLTITCNIHGEFKLKPSKHLSGRGCQECGYEIMRNHKRDSIEDFVRKAKKAHGDKYDYSKVEYVNTYVNVTILCPVHGEFHQMPNHHVKGSGCWKCTGKSPLNTNTFIKRVKDVHGDRYDYSVTDYINTHSNIDIVCKKHGIFKQRASDHLNGSGCPECGIESRANLARNTTESFIEKAKEVHGNKYDYSKFKYIDCKTKGIIVCSEHGEFLQKPNSHLNGSGCNKCGYERAASKSRLTVMEFIKKANHIHGEGTYNYSKFNYRGRKVKGVIICDIHGEFELEPDSHFLGTGCPDCAIKGGAYNITKAEREKQKWVGVDSDIYLIELKSNRDHFLKIGVSCNSGSRIVNIEKESGCKIVDNYIFKTNLYNATMVEQTCIKENRYSRYKPKIKFGGHTECIALEEKENILNYIKSQLIKNYEPN